MRLAWVALPRTATPPDQALGLWMGSGGGSLTTTTLPRAPFVHSLPSSLVATGLPLSYIFTPLHILLSSNTRTIHTTRIHSSAPRGAIPPSCLRHWPKVSRAPAPRCRVACRERRLPSRCKTTSLPHVSRFNSPNATLLAGHGSPHLSAVVPSTLPNRSHPQALSLPPRS
jgi:hypothetical protein